MFPLIFCCQQCKVMMLHYVSDFMKCRVSTSLFSVGKKLNFVDLFVKRVHITVRCCCGMKMRTSIRTSLDRW